MGANDKLRLGAIGLGDRGSGDMGNFLFDPNVEVGGLCDIWADKIERAKTRAPLV